MTLDKSTLAKVPAVTLGFWIIKILATTLGETGGDTVTMTMDLGYLTGTVIFLALLLVLVILADPRKGVSPAPLLGDDRRVDHRRHHARGFRRPVARHRLRGRFLAAAHLRDRAASRSGIASKVRSR